MTTTTYTDDTTNVVSVWSSHGHVFMHEDDNYVSCLTCGALYQLLAFSDDPSSGVYLSNCGDEPMACSHDTSMNHGYPGERVCSCDSDSCTHCSHNCNCISCNS